MKNFDVIVKVDDDQLHRHRIYPRSTFRRNVAEYDVFELAIMEMPHNITPSSLRRLADVLDRRAGKLAQGNALTILKAQYYSVAIERDKLSRQVAELRAAYGHEKDSSSLRFSVAERIEHLLALIDKLARQVEALRANIAAMQNGELPI